MGSSIVPFDVVFAAVSNAATLAPLELLRLGIGLLLLLLVISLIQRTPPAPGRIVPPSTCLRCSQPLTGRRYADRHLPTWVICATC